MPDSRQVPAYARCSTRSFHISTSCPTSYVCALAECEHCATQHVQKFGRLFGIHLQSSCLQARNEERLSLRRLASANKGVHEFAIDFSTFGIRKGINRRTRPTCCNVLHLLFLDRWNLWNRLTRYRKWNESHEKQEHFDGTNNACERAIGWWIKERYRSMRGYKVPANALCVSRLLAWCGNILTMGGANLATLIA